MQPLLRLNRATAAPVGKQLRNRMPKQTCLQRCAGGRARGGNSRYGQYCGGECGGYFL